MRSSLIMVLQFVFLSGFGGEGTNNNRGVHFEEGLSWRQILEKARLEHKYIFVDCFASWCGPCKEMDTEVYSKPEVGDYVNSHFIAVKIQMDSTSKDDDRIIARYADAHQIAKGYSINAYPSFLFFSAEGNILDKDIGYKSSEDFIKLLENAQNSEKQYYTLLMEYKKKELDTSRWKELARRTASFGDKVLAEEIANRYIDQLSDDELFLPENIWLMVDFTGNPMEKGFRVFRDQADRIFQVEKSIGPEQAKSFTENLIYKQEIEPYEYGLNGSPDWARMAANVDKYWVLGRETLEAYRPGILFRTKVEPTLKQDAGWKKTLYLIRSLHAGGGEEFLVGSTIIYYLNSGLMAGTNRDFRNFMGATRLYFNNYSLHLTADPLNNWAWTVFRFDTAVEDLEMALVWSDRAVKLTSDSNAGFIDTYANLLYKLGRTKTALFWEEKSVRLAPENAEILENYSKMRIEKPTWDTH